MAESEAVAYGIPEVGIIVRTSIPNLPIRRIYYAQVRKKTYDLVCVRDGSLEIFSIEPESKLKSIASFHPVNTLIKSSLVLPLPTSSDLEAEMKGEGTLHDSLPEMVTSEQNDIPTQTIVLVVQLSYPQQQPYDQLVFVSPSEIRTGKVQLSFNHHHLGKESPSTIGTKMVADPRGRFLALTRESKHIILYRIALHEVLRCPPEQSNRIENGYANPIREERQIFLENDQFIWFMEFLSSSKANSDTAHLIVITGSSDQRCKLLYLCEIDYTTNLNKQRFKMSLVARLGNSTSTRGLDRLQFIMPLQSSPGLILGARNCLGLLTDVTLPQPSISLHPYAINDDSIVTTYAFYPNTLHKAALSSGLLRDSYNDMNTDYDELAFLVHEDGQIESLTMEVVSGQESKIEITPWGSSGHNINEAFVIIELPGDRGWAFINGGSFSNGGIEDILAVPSSDPWTIITNPEPVIDSVAVPAMNYTDKRKYIFATTNRGSKHGTISQIRYGHPIRKLENIRTTREAVSSAVISKMWVLPYDGETYLATATATGSVCELYNLQGSSNGNSLFQILEDAGDIITVAFVRKGYFLLVTMAGVYQINADLSVAASLAAKELKVRELDDCKIMLAFIDFSSSTILLVVFQSGAWILYYLSTNDDYQTNTRSIVLDNEPTCIYMNHGHGERFPVALLSTQSGMLQAYALGASSISLLGMYDIGPTDSACESLLLVTKSSKLDVRNSEGATLLCGLRSGLLICFDFIIKQNDAGIYERGSIRIGSTSVQLSLQSQDDLTDTSENSTIVFCEDMLYQYVDDGQNFSESNLTPLWCTDLAGRGLRQSAILAVEVVPAWVSNIRLGFKHVICATRDAVWRGRIESDGSPRSTPRQIHVGGSPKRIIWSNHHKRLVVALDLELTVPSQPQRFAKSKTSVFQAVAMIDPDQDDEERIKVEQTSVTNLDSIRSRYAIILDSSKQRINSLAEWDIIQNGRTYHMLLVSIIGDPTGGKVCIYGFKDLDKPLELKGMWRAKEVGSVHCATAYDPTSIVVATSLYLLQLSITVESGSYRFRETARSILPSASGRTIRVDSFSGRIFITTQIHALMVYELGETGFKLVLHDTTGGQCVDSTTVSSHLAVGSNMTEQITMDSTAVASTLAVGSNNTEQITLQVCFTPTAYESASEISGLYHAPGQLTPIFRHTLPGRVMRLQQASLRPPLRPNSYLPYPRIMASTLNGAWYSIDMLDLKIWRLLRFLQNLWLRSHTSILLPASGLSGYMGPNPVTSPTYDRDVDGDTLREWLSVSPSPEAVIMEMLEDNEIQELRMLLNQVFGNDKLQDQVYDNVVTLISILRAIVDAP